MRVRSPMKLRGGGISGVSILMEDDSCDCPSCRLETIVEMMDATTDMINRLACSLDETGHYDMQIVIAKDRLGNMHTGNGTLN